MASRRAVGAGEPRPPGRLKRARRWVVRRPSYMLLTANDQTLQAEPARRFRHVWLGLMVLSGGWGIGSAGLWEGMLKLFDLASGLPLMEAGIVLAVTVLWLYRRAVGALAGVFAGGQPQARPVTASVLVALLLLIFLALKGWNPDWPTHLAPMWRWMRPRAMYRPLILAPLWGGWAMLILGQFRRPGPETPEALREMYAGCGPLLSAIWMAVPLAGSLIYFNYMTWWQATIPGVTVLAAVVGGLVLCRLTGGLKRCTLLAGNLLTQIVFYLSYLANR
ncbi:MAG: hypothetical protein ACOC93_01950 [Planctomycetota bacterium]